MYILALNTQYVEEPIMFKNNTCNNSTCSTDLTRRGQYISTYLHIISSLMLNINDKNNIKTA